MSNAIRVGKIENYYGFLSVKEEDGKYYWGIEDHSSMFWEQIPQALYIELVKLENPEV